MPKIISDLFQIQNRFLRSAHIERDFADPKALTGYVFTPQTLAYLERLASGLSPNSGQRAWRITGDFGTGKSSFALVTAHLFAGKSTELPLHLRQAVNFNNLNVSQPRLLPVLVTGSREPLAIALLRSLHRSLIDTCERGRLPQVIDKIAAELDNPSKNVSEDTVIKLLTEASLHITSTNKGTGILVILDELGKFLEFAALNPDRQDVFLLQELAEAASRSGKNPLFLLGLLHQGFNAYADQLSQSAQKEWEKVAGRFEELIFNQPLEQTATLVADALNVRVDSLSSHIIEQANQDMRTSLSLGWYGAAYTKNLPEMSSGLYPLHPSVLPVLVKLFSRFGQNERSLFSFLLSNEPFGLQEFARRSINTNEFYRLHHLYDYARATFGHRLSVQSYRSHWNQIDSMIESFPAAEPLELEILKTVGLLNMLDTNNLIASEDAINLATVGYNASNDNIITNTIHKLQKSKRVLYFRGAAGGYCLWPHTSVNLEKAYEDASRLLGYNTQRIFSSLWGRFATRVYSSS